MGTKTVSDLYQRTWSVSRRIAWRLPATEEEAALKFEHDVDGGRGSAVLVLSSLLVFWVILLVWRPDDIHLPWWYWLLFVLIVMFFPIRWVVRRQREIIAETAGHYSHPAERWTGVVRGRLKSREEVRILEQRLRTDGTPRHADTPLKQDVQLAEAEKLRLGEEQTAD